MSVYDDDVKHAESARGQKAESINFISFSVSSRLLMWLFDAFEKKIPDDDDEEMNEYSTDADGGQRT